MENMPHRGSNLAGNNNPATSGRRHEERSFLDDVELPKPKEETKPMNHMKRGRYDDDKGGKVKLIIGGIVAVIVLIAIIVAVKMFMTPSAHTTVGIDKNQYQAVFFTNGQVYFGKLKEMSPSSMSLTDVYYLETQNDDQKDEKDSKNPQSTSAQDSSNVKLIKLGNEIHGPEDEMIISKDQVLFFENLKQDGKVAQTIKQYKTQKN
jgi:hypothetical protein